MGLDRLKSCSGTRKPKQKRPEPAPRTPEEAARLSEEAFSLGEDWSPLVWLAAWVAASDRKTAEDLGSSMPKRK
ncbi:hypothetical protein GCM10027563_41550 [Parasphingorhabdus pacifica]